MFANHRPRKAQWADCEFTTAGAGVRSRVKSLFFSFFRRKTLLRKLLPAPTREYGLAAREF